MSRVRTERLEACAPSTTARRLPLYRSEKVGRTAGLPLRVRFIAALDLADPPGLPENAFFSFAILFGASETVTVPACG